MTSNLTINKEVRNGVEYWVSDDASRVGMSLSGLAVMCPVALSSIAKLVNDYSNNAPLPSESLEALRSEGLAITEVAQERGGKPVKFIPAELCAAIVEYFALDNKRINEDVRSKCQTTLRLFNRVGVKMYILNQVGYKVISPDQKSDSDRLDFIISEMREMKELTKRYVNIKEATKTKPGLEHILNTYERGYLLTDGKYFSLKTWLEAKGLDLTRSERISLGMAVHATFKTHGKQQAPVYQKVRMYTAEDVPLLEAALKNI